MADDDKKPEKPRTITDETSYEVRGNTNGRPNTTSKSDIPRPKRKQ